MANYRAGLTLNEYQKLALQADKKPASMELPLLGLFGETGSLLSVVKKKQRDRTSYLGYAPHVVEELGDVLWYFAVVAARGRISLSDIGHNLDRGLSDWRDSGGNDLQFRALQSSSTTAIPTEPTAEFEKTLLDLTGNVGILLADHQSGRLISNQSALKGGLVTIMRSLVKAATDAGVSIDDAAQANLNKIFDRWPMEKHFPPALDHDARDDEKLPRHLTIDIFEREVGGKIFVFQRCNEVNIGDRLAAAVGSATSITTLWVS